MYDPDSENELNGYFGMVEHDDNSDKDKEDNISRAKVRPIKNTKNKKLSFLTVNKSVLKET